MARGAGQAIAENKVADKVALIGFDNDDKLVGFLKDGTIAALVVQDPYRMGYDGVKTALAASKKEKIEAFVDTGANLITKANMAEPKHRGSAQSQGELKRRGAPSSGEGRRAIPLGRRASRKTPDGAHRAFPDRALGRQRPGGRRRGAGDVILELVDLEKRYGPVLALKPTSLAFRRGEIHAVVGENGAGKSTLIKLLTGVIPAHRGRDLLERRSGRPRQPAGGDRPRHQRRTSGGRALPPSPGRRQHLPRRRDGEGSALLQKREMTRAAQRILDDMGFTCPPACSSTR